MASYGGTDQAEWVLYADGASRGNPGPSAIGAALFASDGLLVHEVSRSIGRATNNQAEYAAAVAALEAALALAARRVELRMDSQLVIRQLQGHYRVRNPALRRLRDRILDLSHRFDSLTFRHIPREENHKADALANRALDRLGNAER